MPRALCAASEDRFAQDRLRVLRVLVFGSLLFLIAGVAAVLDVRRILDLIGMR